MNVCLCLCLHSRGGTGAASMTSDRPVANSGSVDRAHIYYKELSSPVDPGHRRPSGSCVWPTE